MHAKAIIKRLDLKLSYPNNPINPPVNITGRLAISANGSKWFYLILINNFLLNNMTARKVPKWAPIASNSAFSSQLNISCIKYKWAELDTGRNSVTPWIIEYKKICIFSIFFFFNDDILVYENFDLILDV